MNKKLIAVAVAGLFVAPAAALAQSSVTISGKLMTSFGQYNQAIGTGKYYLQQEWSNRSARCVLTGT